MDNQLKKKVINIFSQLSNIYSEIGDTYRALAYSKAILAIINDESRGIGTSIKEKINEIKRTGHLKLLDELKKNPIVKDKLELLKIHGITNKFIQTHNLKSVSDLQERFNNGTLKLTHGQQLGLEYHEELSRKIPRGLIKQVGNKIIKKVKEIKGVKSAEIVGSYRREAQASKDIDILVVSTTKDINVEVQKKLRDIILGTFASGKTKLNAVMETSYGIHHVDIMYARPDEYATALLAFTGSAGFNRLMRLRAIERGMKLNEFGLYKNNKKIPTRTESDVFKKLNLNYINPSGRSLK